MPRSAPKAPDCNRELTALLGIGSIRWFGDFGFISFIMSAPKVQTLISPGATPWETRSPTGNPSPEGAQPVLPFQGAKIF